MIKRLNKRFYIGATCIAWDKTNDLDTINDMNNRLKCFIRNEK